MHSVRHLLISFSRSLPNILGQVFFYTICIYISNPIYIVILFSYWFSKNTLSFSKLEVNITVSNQYLSVWSNIFFYFEKKNYILHWSKNVSEQISCKNVLETKIIIPWKWNYTLKMSITINLSYTMSFQTEPMRSNSFN